MSNIYHILNQKPFLEKYEMPFELEELALKLVRSGRLRIDAEDKVNFVRFSIPEIGANDMFSWRELHSKRLLKRTRTIICEHIGRGCTNENIWQHIIHLRKLLKKHDFVDFNLEMKIARILVQSVHPIIMNLLLFENVQVFVSYAYNIGDMLDVVTWQQAGQNSGMQSTNGVDAAIFVSAGGNPFRPNKDEEPIFGDGEPAIARMMVIAAQEFGHYADLIRGQIQIVNNALSEKQISSRFVNRHSANLSCTMAHEHVRIARIQDVANVQNIRAQLESIGLKKVMHYEKHIKFFREHKRSGIVKLLYLINMLIFRRIFLSLSYAKSMHWFVKYFFKFQYVGLIIDDMLKDMEFNLAPKADVYERDDKNEEEAIKCVEALARVPQQAIKWGHRNTIFIMPGLYKIYYGKVIEQAKKDYIKITNSQFKINLKKRPHYLKRMFYRALRKLNFKFFTSVF